MTKIEYDVDFNQMCFQISLADPPQNNESMQKLLRNIMQILIAHLRSN